MAISKYPEVPIKPPKIKNPLSGKARAGRSTRKGTGFIQMHLSILTKNDQAIYTKYNTTIYTKFMDCDTSCPT